MRATLAQWTTLITVVMLASCGVATHTPVTGDAKRFVFVGDMPYDLVQSDRLTNVIGPRIRADDFPFLVHYGDLKSGSTACGDVALRDAHDVVTSLISTDGSRPVFYTPGDNDWTDCDRDFSFGDSRSELAQLDLLRRVFYAEPPSGVPDDWHYQHQESHPENALWRHGGVQFATVHVVGTNNGRTQILRDAPDIALALVEARDRANHAWLDEAFAAARRSGEPAQAVIVAIHADVTTPRSDVPCTTENPSSCDAFAGFRAQLIGLAGAFSKPVLLVHGDTGDYCLDKTFGGIAAPNLWRLNAGGDYHQPLDATVVTVGSGVPFAVAGLVDGEAPADGC